MVIFLKNPPICIFLIFLLLCYNLVTLLLYLKLADTAIIMTLQAKIAYNTTVQVISKIISVLLGLISIGLITRYLGQSGFGQYTTIFTFLSFFATIGDLGLTLITSQMISRPGANENKIISNLFTIRLFSAIFFLCLAPLAVFLFPYGSDVKIGVLIVALAFFFTALNQIFIGLFQKNLVMTKAALAESGSRLILLLVVIAAYFLHWGLNGILLASVIANFFNFLILYLYSRPFIKLKFNFDWTLWREIISKSWPLTLTITFNLIYLKTDTFILSLIKSPAEVGLYGAAYRVIDVITTLPFMFAGLILPLLAKAWAEKKSTDFNNILQRSFDALVILALPLIFGTQLLATRIMTLVAGSNFSASGPILQILMIAIFFIFIGTLFAHSLIAAEIQKKAISAYFFVGLTSLIGYLIFIPQYSYFGAAAVTIYSEIAISLALFWLAKKYTNFSLKLKTFFKSLGASITMLAVIEICKNFNLIIIIIIGITIYFLTLYILGGITKKDFYSLINKTSND